MFPQDLIDQAIALGPQDDRKDDFGSSKEPIWTFLMGNRKVKNIGSCM